MMGPDQWKSRRRRFVAVPAMPYGPRAPGRKAPLDRILARLGRLSRSPALLTRRDAGRDWRALTKIADEQAALRRVAELVARGAPEHDLFLAVANEASDLIREDSTLLRIERDGTYTVIATHGGPAPMGTRLTVAANDLGVVAEIARTRRPARRDDYRTGTGPAYARDDYGVHSSVAVPIVVDGQIWGILGATSPDHRLPSDTETRFAQFAELVAAALATVQVRSDIQQLVNEQTALRAVAEQVARAVPPDELFAAVTAEASHLLMDAPMTMTQFGATDDLVVLAALGGPAPVGTQISYQPDTLPARVRRSGAAVRVDDYTREPDSQLAASFKLAAAVSVPISVAGEVWGMLTATSEMEPLPAATEDRLSQFTGLVTAALENIHTRSKLRSLADEQAALRSVAELAARDAPVEDVLAAIARQASRLAGVEFTIVFRYEADGATEIVALDGAPPGFAVGMRAPSEGDSAVQRVWRTGQPARVDQLGQMSGRWPKIAQARGFSTSAGVPILLHATLWGAVVVVGRTEPLPPEFHTQLTSFAELAGTAISAAQAREEVVQLAVEQSALRRVAEIVARDLVLSDVLTAIATEASRLVGDVATALVRFDSDGFGVTVAVCNSPAPLGLRVPLTDGSATGAVRRTGRAARIDSYDGHALQTMSESLGIVAAVAVPITIEERVWGALTGSSLGDPLPLFAEDRLTQFAELAAVAIANAVNKHKLTASRARVVATADETRRRLQRDVHDGAQQRLVHTIISLKLAKDAIAAGDSAAEFVDEALNNAQRANADLRDVVRGILPASLTRGGLSTGIESLIADFSLPIHCEITTARLAKDVETTAYFVVAESLNNVVKHARATRAIVTVAENADALTVVVTDDGVGGADFAQGSGLTGLLDRVEAGNGVLTVVSELGRGTTIRATLPVDTRNERPTAL